MWWQLICKQCTCCFTVHKKVIDTWWNTIEIIKESNCSIAVYIGTQTAFSYNFFGQKYSFGIVYKNLNYFATL